MAFADTDHGRGRPLQCSLEGFHYFILFFVSSRDWALEHLGWGFMCIFGWEAWAIEDFSRKPGHYSCCCGCLIRTGASFGVSHHHQIIQGPIFQARGPKSSHHGHFVKSILFRKRRLEFFSKKNFFFPLFRVRLWSMGGGRGGDCIFIDTR